MVDEKFSIQEAEYEFPYHHVPHFRGGVPSSIRRLGWGLEYLCYQRVVADMVAELRPASVLDVGCGDGRFLGLVDARIRKGVDLSEVAVRFARAFHPEIEFAVADIADLTEQFDVVTSIETLEHIPDEGVTGFVRALAMRCRIGGHVLVSVPTTNVPVNRKHYRHYDLALLEQQVAASGASLVLEAHEFVFRGSAALDLMRRATFNRLWSAEIAPLQRLAWHYVWTRLRHASASDGRHLVARFARTA